MSEEHLFHCDWCRTKAPSTDDLGKGKWQYPDGWDTPHAAGGDLLCGTCQAHLAEAIAAVKHRRSAP